MSAEQPPIATKEQKEPQIITVVEDVEEEERRINLDGFENVVMLDQKTNDGLFECCAGHIAKNDTARTIGAINLFKNTEGWKIESEDELQQLQKKVNWLFEETEKLKEDDINKEQKQALSLLSKSNTQGIGPEKQRGIHTILKVHQKIQENFPDKFCSAMEQIKGIAGDDQLDYNEKNTLVQEELKKNAEDLEYKKFFLKALSSTFTLEKLTNKFLNQEEISGELYKKELDKILERQKKVWTNAGFEEQEFTEFMKQQEQEENNKLLDTSAVHVIGNVSQRVRSTFYMLRKENFLELGSPEQLSQVQDEIMRFEIDLGNIQEDNKDKEALSALSLFADSKIEDTTPEARGMAERIVQQYQKFKKIYLGKMEPIIEEIGEIVAKEGVENEQKNLQINEQKQKFVDDEENKKVLLDSLETKYRFDKFKISRQKEPDQYDLNRLLLDAKNSWKSAGFFEEDLIKHFQEEGLSSKEGEAT